MIETIKITMLADSSVGKTCYMLGMYGGLLMNDHGFSLTVKDQDQDAVLTAQWNNIIEQTGLSRWPAGTISTSQYNFCLNYAGETLTEFQWLDYRGGAISDVSSNDDVKELRQYLAQSSCLFLSISGEHLINSVEKNLGLAMVKTKANTINNHLVYLRTEIDKRNQKFFPVVIAISKYDYCYQRPKQEIIADIKKLFPILFRPNSKWLVMICPISLGIELANNPDGQINPINCHLPLIFALWSTLRQDVLFTHKTIEQINTDLQDIDNMNWLEKVINKKKINDKEQKLEHLENRKKKHITYMEQLKIELQTAYIYLQGEEIQIN